MKPTMLLVAAALAAMPSMQAASQATPAPDARAEVAFVSPDKFTDVRDSYTGSESARDATLEQIREYFVEQAKRFVPEGYKLSVSVTDIDLAGDFEPWRGPNWDDVRVVKDIYPPRITMSFRLTDSTGKVVKEGKRDLRDLAFMMKITTVFRDDPLRHEKTLISDWFRDEFRDIRKS
ncbi:DUF3016 domain-containing protein [Opitutus sp. ER46]|uniref:DUF3016 domain-containing protein n=1 Tax=Opitutus sp. ER46 TaxID=2161864 RepID=UPI001304A28A|nr:DUF3016 domain-containing protein [Opitutus sp. ER46]